MADMYICPKAKKCKRKKRVIGEWKEHNLIPHCYEHEHKITCDSGDSANGCPACIPSPSPSEPHLCTTCQNDFPTCKAGKIVWGIDRHRDARGEDADKVLECDAYKSEPAPQPSLEECWSETGNILNEDTLIRYVYQNMSTGEIKGQKHTIYSIENSRPSPANPPMGYILLRRELLTITASQRADKDEAIKQFAEKPKIKHWHKWSDGRTYHHEHKKGDVAHGHHGSRYGGLLFDGACTNQ